MRAASDAELWVARAPGIIAGLSLSAVGEGFWLTGLFVDPQRRGQRVAARLIEAALAQADGPVWLFCHPTCALLSAPGFRPGRQLPEALAGRLQRYQRSKRLVACSGVSRR
jgi:GNAT superfamily N-acetyltransferase